ncbi:hypothetical protein HZB01_03600 [Candidatus Woesearchaeota archaeon]|nr:hypothetical protein [Candidatus Woesearchaeota archaeon]
MKKLTKIILGIVLIPVFPIVVLWGVGFVVPLFFFAVGLFMFFGCLEWFKVKRIIENTPTSKIRSLAMGIVEIAGSVILSKNNLIKSPFFQTSCAYYKYWIEGYDNRGKNRAWRIIAMGEHHTLFFLKDETGMVTVDPKGAIFNIEKYEVSTDSQLLQNPSPSVKSILDEKKLSYALLTDRYSQFRCTEQRIATGDKLYILGSAGKNPFVKQGEAQENVQGIMMQQGKNEKLYYISDSPEKKILQDIKRRLWTGLIIGGSLTVGLGYLIIRYVMFWLTR